ncbi:hypothetical protein TXYLGN1_14420 [Tepidimicrobium xylanilyticum]
MLAKRTKDFICYASNIGVKWSKYSFNKFALPAFRINFALMILGI